MKALDFPLFADENIHPDVIAFLRKIGLNVDSVSEQGKSLILAEFVVMV